MFYAPRDFENDEEEEGRKGSSEKALTRFPEIFSRLVFRSTDHLDGTSNLPFLHAFSLLSSLAGSWESCLRPLQSQFRGCVSPAISHWVSRFTSSASLSINFLLVILYLTALLLFESSLCSLKDCGKANFLVLLYVLRISKKKI